MRPKNTICLWFDNDAQGAASFYAATFPNSAVTAVRKAPADFPGGKQGSVLMVEFTVFGIPCIGLNGGPEFKLKVTASLSRRPVVEALQNPVLVLAILEFDEGRPQFLQVAEAAYPQKLFFESAKEALNTPIAFRLTDEGRG